jgi:hypothetical protein
VPVGPSTAVSRSWPSEGGHDSGDRSQQGKSTTGGAALTGAEQGKSTSLRWINYRDGNAGDINSTSLRRGPALLSTKQAPAWEDTHATIPPDEYLLVINLAVLLLNAIQDYVGEDVILDEKIHRLQSFRHFRKHGMLPRIYNQILQVSGHHSLHYSWFEWVNLRVVQQVVEEEMRLLCTHKHWSDGNKYMCLHMTYFDATARWAIMQDVLRNWPFYRQDAVTQIQQKFQEKYETDISETDRARLV